MQNRFTEDNEASWTSGDLVGLREFCVWCGRSRSGNRRQLRRFGHCVSLRRIAGIAQPEELSLLAEGYEAIWISSNYAGLREFRICRHIGCSGDRCEFRSISDCVGFGRIIGVAQPPQEVSL